MSASTPTSPTDPNDSGVLRQRWRSAWQAPLLLAAILTLVAGVVAILRSAPDPDLGAALDAGEHMIDAGEPTKAIEMLNAEVFPYVGTAKLSGEEVAKFHTLIARAIFLGQKAAGIEREDNHTNIADSYAEAETHGATLSPRDAGYLAESLTALGRLAEARARIEGIPREERERRVQLQRGLIMASMSPAHRDDEMALELVTALLTEPELPGELKAWALARQAELQIDRGYADQAINRLLRETPRLADASPTAAGELSLLLARAYLEATPREPLEAARQLETAERLIPPEDPARGQLRLLQGRVAEIAGDRAEALDHFTHVIEHGLDDRWRATALLGAAESAAALGELDEAADFYTRLSEMIREGRASREAGREQAVASMLARAAERQSAGDAGHALRLATLAEELAGGAELPAEGLATIAAAHRRLADDIIAAVKGASASVASLADLDPVTRTQVREHMISSGVYSRRHAERLVTADVEASYDSLWKAADAFDRAGDQDTSLQLFRQFSDDRPGDKRQPEALLRLATAYQSRGDFDLAAEVYTRLIQSRDSAGGAGPYADASYVPLAQTYLRDGKADNDGLAVEILERIASGAIAGPESSMFKRAVLELGEHAYRQGQYERAIERFREALERYPSEEQAHAWRFRLADSQRLLASRIESTLREAMPDSERRQLEAERRNLLGDAMMEFEQTRRAVEALDPRRRTPVDELYLRNAYFYLGETAFNLGDYSAAIRHYDAARERYANEPAALAAMTQIVTAYLRLGDTARAAAANERARRFYGTIPDEAWNDPALPMTRADWQRWLEATAELWSLTQTRTAGASEPAAETDGH